MSRKVKSRDSLFARVSFFTPNRILIMSKIFGKKKVKKEEVKEVPVASTVEQDALTKQLCEYCFEGSNFFLRLISDFSCPHLKNKLNESF